MIAPPPPPQLLTTVQPTLRLPRSSSYSLAQELIPSRRFLRPTGPGLLASISYVHLIHPRSATPPSNRSGGIETDAHRLLLSSAGVSSRPFFTPTHPPEQSCLHPPSTCHWPKPGATTSRRTDQIALKMTWLTKTLGFVLVVSFTSTVHGQNSCLTSAACSPGTTELTFESCDITDDGLPELSSCINSAGRGGITLLKITDNPLTTIPCDLLEGMTALEELWMDSCLITFIEEGALQHVAPTLQMLSLRYNNLETLPPNRFVGMGALEYVWLRGNQLTSLHADSFVGLTGMKDLGLRDNELTTLPAGLFDDVVSSGTLSLLVLVGNLGLQCIPIDVDTRDGGLDLPTTVNFCECTADATCSDGVACTPGEFGYTCDEVPPTVCTDDSDCDTPAGEVCFPFLDICGVPETTTCNPATTACDPGVAVCDDPHMQGLRGQRIDWSGVDGGWYCLVTDNNANVHVNVRLTAPLPEAFPDRQLITGLSIVSEGHSLAIEVTNPYNVRTDGCPREISPCLADGGLRVIVDGEEVGDLLRPSRNKNVVDGIAVSASNLPVECREFGGDTIWARMYDEMLQGTRQLDVDESFEDWILSFDHMAAVNWCTQYIAQHSLADVQSNHAIFKIVTSAVTVRLNVGTNFQGDGELDWDGRVLPNLEFWQMDVGLHGLSIESQSLSGILGETARPVLDKDGHEVMEGFEAFRGMVEDYLVSGPLGTDFALINMK